MREWRRHIKAETAKSRMRGEMASAPHPPRPLQVAKGQYRVFQIAVAEIARVQVAPAQPGVLQLDGVGNAAPASTPMSGPSSALSSCKTSIRPPFPTLPCAALMTCQAWKCFCLILSPLSEKWKITAIRNENVQSYRLSGNLRIMPAESRRLFWRSSWLLGS
jgi:hypothetical protein